MAVVVLFAAFIYSYLKTSLVLLLHESVRVRSNLTINRVSFLPRCRVLTDAKVRNLNVYLEQTRHIVQLKLSVTA
jgi:hypothetical protein